MSGPVPAQADAPHQRRPDVAHLPSAYFAIVMATGIVSTAAAELGLTALAWLLFGVALVAYVVLWALNILRLRRHPRIFLSDLTDHRLGPGFFTMVAASAVLGNGSLLLAGSLVAGVAFWIVAGTLWIVLTYTIFTALTVKEEKPSLEKGISGAWLLAVVATQSIAVLSALIAVHIPQPWRLELNFLALSMWLWGGMLYIWMMSLIFYRYTFFRFAPSDLSPPYWINMGAMAISTLAGSLLIQNSDHAPFLLSIVPFMKGFTVFYWATGTWWIPMLLILFVWRHAYRRFPLRYDPLYWGAVFPIGMYAVSTYRMSRALEMPFLEPLAGAFAVIALAVWTVAFLALCRVLLRRQASPDPA